MLHSTQSLGLSPVELSEIYFWVMYRIVLHAFSFSVFILHFSLHRRCSVQHFKLLWINISLSIGKVVFFKKGDKIGFYESTIIKSGVKRKSKEPLESHQCFTLTIKRFDKDQLISPAGLSVQKIPKQK